jgi:DNA-binding NtrC family response regulator
MNVILLRAEQRARAVIIVAASGQEPGVEKELKARGISVQWAHSIKAASGLLDSAVNGTVVITELALRDGNWRDLVERVRCIGKYLPVVLLSSTRTAELWWEALDCGVEDILQAPLSASLLSEYLGKRLTTEK